jgi:ubiquinone/menaquinone biosynthesis C-methylase UbiE
VARQDYDRMAEMYGRHRRLHPLVLEALIEQGELREGSRVLEIGCGTGNYIRAIVEATGALGTGVDPSREMLRRAGNTAGLPSSRRDAGNRPAVTFIEGRAEELPLADRQFDLVYSVDVIHHVEGRDAAARELARVLKPGGAGMIVTESEDDLRNRTPQVTYFPETIAVELKRYPTIETIETELRSAGLEIGAEVAVSMPQEVDDIAPFRDKAFSSLHLIPEAAFRDGLMRMEADLKRGPVSGVRRYTIVVARKPA